MQENHNTYTYTARSASYPDNVVTFTLENSHMRVNLTDVMEQAGRIAEAQEKPQEIRRQLSTQVKPIMTKVVENISGPVHIADVNANLDDEQLKVILWQRVSGLRVAPVLFNMGQVDNPDAARSFVDELKQRKQEAAFAGRFPGLLDYWAGWLGLLVGTLAFLGWLRKREQALH